MKAEKKRTPAAHGFRVVIYRVDAVETEVQEWTYRDDANRERMWCEPSIAHDRDQVQVFDQVVEDLDVAAVVATVNGLQQPPRHSIEGPRTLTVRDIEP